MRTLRNRTRTALDRVFERIDVATEVVELKEPDGAELIHALQRCRQDLRDALDDYHFNKREN